MLIECNNIKKYFGDKLILDIEDLKIYKGDRIVTLYADRVTVLLFTFTVIYKH